MLGNTGALSGLEERPWSGTPSHRVLALDPMSLHIKPLHDGALQVENDSGNWLIFSLDELRSHSVQVRADMVEGTPKLPEAQADLFAWAAFAAARGYAVEHGLVPDDRPKTSR